MLLVTGATGYLGSALVKALLAAGEPVRAVVRTEARAAALPAGVPYAVAELGDPDALYAAATDCTAVFHLAASIGSSLAETRELNVAGTRNVLDAAARAGVGRFVHTSTGAAIIDPTGLVSEEAPPGVTAFTDPYSVTKAEAEALVLDSGLPAVVVSPVAIYGPSPAGAGSYNALFAAAASGRVTEVVDARVGWVLAEDVARGMLLAHRHGSPGRRYVLCGEVAGFGEVLHRYASLVNSPHRVRALPPGSSLGPDAGTFARRSEVYGKLAPVRVDDAATHALGLTPRPLSAGLPETATWMHTLPS